jgi:hypothetical protein
MSVPLRLAGFVVVLVLAFGGAALAGSLVDPTDAPAPAAGGHGGETHGAGAPDAPDAASHGAAEHAPAPAQGVAPAGLAVSQDGFGLDVERRTFAAGERAPLRFRVTDPRGRPVTDAFEPAHERELHLIVVRRDTAHFQHVHPRKGADGTWSIDLTLPAAGVYRAYADFTVAGTQRTLATDLVVPGDFRPEPLPAPAAVDRAGDLAVALTTPGPRAGRETELSFAVTRGGAPFAGLEPYLGAKGHLVALRDGDLAYLHVHPVEGGGGHAHADGSTAAEEHPGEVRFAATFPTPGRYRLFLQVKAGGAVRTVAHTVAVRR